jgi:photosystem II stability/assembly factor-like uncharacterized protein
LYLSTDDGIFWEDANPYIGINTGFFSNFYKNNDELYIVDGYIYKFDFAQRKWYIPYDTSKGKLGGNAMTIFNAKIITGSNLKKSNTEQGKKVPNIFIYNLSSKEFISVIDSISGINKYTITSFVVKDNKIFAGTTGGVFISTDDGINWKKKSKGLQYEVGANSFDYEVHKLFVKGNYVYAIITYPTQSGSFPGSGNIAYSTDDGENWNFPDPYQILPDVFLSNVEATDINCIDNQLILTTQYGIYSSSDSISNFVSIKDTIMCGGIVRDMAVSQGKIFAVLGYGVDQNNTGLWVSEDQGNTWIQPNNEMSLLDLTKIAVKDSFIIVGNGYYEKNPWYSTDNGKTFSKITKEQGLDYLQTFTIKIIDDTIYIGTRNGIYYSKDWAKTWKKLNDSLNNQVIYYITNYENYMFAGSNNNLFFISEDNGLTWKKSIIPFNDYILKINDIKVINKSIYIGTTGYIRDGIYLIQVGGGIFTSTDFGSTWVSYNTGFPNYLGVLSIEAIGEYKFLSADWNHAGGVFYTSNYGSKWYPYNKGLTNSKVLKLLIQGNYLYAATSGGMYRVPLSDFGIVSVNDYEIEKRNYLYSMQPYPIPATNRVQAEIYWDKALEINQANIKVYNIYGEEINSKDKIEVIPESDWYGKLIWNCEGSEPGVYIITINYGTEKKAIKVIKN